MSWAQSDWGFGWVTPEGSPRLGLPDNSDTHVLYSCQMMAVGVVAIGGVGLSEVHFDCVVYRGQGRRIRNTARKQSRAENDWEIRERLASVLSALRAHDQQHGGYGWSCPSSHPWPPRLTSRPSPSLSNTRPLGLQGIPRLELLPLVHPSSAASITPDPVPRIGSVCVGGLPRDTSLAVV